MSSSIIKFFVRFSWEWCQRHLSSSNVPMSSTTSFTNWRDPSLALWRNFAVYGALMMIGSNVLGRQSVSKRKKITIDLTLVAPKRKWNSSFYLSSVLIVIFHTITTTTYELIKNAKIVIIFYVEDAVLTLKMKSSSLKLLLKIRR